ncbi:hypothetical protein [Gilliamella sp.]|uniref:hypothetical protein n=1 Tax=Gilliamella sp. TaxID=1891236 RepID=UPI0025D60213|nr:hypothetical protein [Gilliamella sp.]
MLFFAPLLLLPYSISLQALSAQTSGVIQGTAPYLTFDDGATKIMSVEGLLGIKLPNGLYIPSGINSPLYPNATVDTSSVDNPIEMPNITNTFADIQTIVPVSNYPEVLLTNLVNAPYNYGRDDDGDEGINATGKLTIKWQDSSGRDITEQVKNNPNKQLNLCDAPYQLTLTVTNGNLSTQYGIPNSSDFTGNKHSYYINPKMDMPIVCYAQPNLYVDNLAWGSEYDLDGPNWVANKGFKVLDVSNPAENFPTTGADRLYFYLLLGGITPEQVIVANGTTVSAESGTGISLSLSKDETPKWEDWLGNPVSAYFGGDKGLKVLLKGPSINSTNKVFTPSLFKLYADSSHTKLLYSFKIERWYIVQPGKSAGYANAQRFCQNLGNGYRIPDINDYSNANNFGWTGGIPRRSSAWYQRRLSYQEGNRWIGGLFNEWGRTYNGTSSYFGSDWDSGDGYWTAQPSGIYDQYIVNSGDGYINITYLTQSEVRVACVVP